MAAIRHNLQQELFRPSEEALYSVLNVAKVGASKKKKATFLCTAVTKEKPFQVRIYKVQKSEKEVYKKKHSWALSDLKIVDGKEQSIDVLEFDLHFDKVYKWVASRVADRNEFIETLWSLSNRYLVAKKPAFVNVNQRILDGDYASKVRSGSNPPQAAIAPEAQDDYQKLSVKEENDINTMLSQFQDALGNVEQFADQLSSELQELEYVNITSLMGSEQQARDLLALIDKSIQELDLLDRRLTSYDEALQKVSDQMGQMEFKDNRMEVERGNNKRLTEEVKYIVGKLDISQRHIRSLREGDLYNQVGIAECVSAAKILLDAFHTSFSPGITELRAVQEQLDNIMKLKSEFAQRFYLHLDKFISQHSNVELTSMRPSADLSLPAHDSMHADFHPYIELMKWLKDLNNDKYLEIKVHYEESFSKCYEKEFREYMDMAKMKASLKIKAAKSGQSLASTSSSESVPSAKSMSLRRIKKEPQGRLKRSSSKESIDSMASVESSSSVATSGFAVVAQYEQVFDAVVSEVQPYVMAEQDFCATFFHLKYPGDSENSEAAAPLVFDDPDGGLLSRARQAAVERNVTVRRNVDEVRDMMKNIFSFMETDLQNFISYGENLHAYNILYVMVRIQNQASLLVTSQVTGSPPTFLGTLFGGLLVYTKRLFDKFVDNFCKHMDEIKVQKKKKTGIMSEVYTFEKFTKFAENVFRGSERRSDVDKAYSKMLAVLFKKIETVAMDSEKSPPEIVMFENYHYVHGILAGMKLAALEKEKKQARQSYYLAMEQYIASRLGRPMERLSTFFQGVESCIASGVRMEDVGYQIAFNQQELKSILKDYPPKEIKRGLEVLYRKMEKYVTEPGLAQVMWHNMQEAFVHQLERYQELITMCYPSSNARLSVTIQDILEFFSSIAQSH